MNGKYIWFRFPVYLTRHFSHTHIYRSTFCLISASCVVLPNGLVVFPSITPGLHFGVLTWTFFNVIFDILTKEGTGHLVPWTNGQAI